VHLAEVIDAVRLVGTGKVGCSLYKDQDCRLEAAFVYGSWPLGVAECFGSVQCNLTSFQRK